MSSPNPTPSARVGLWEFGMGPATQLSKSKGLYDKNIELVRALFENQIIRTPLYQIYRKVRMPNRLFNLTSKTT